ncbi:MAG: hypothetical protein ACK5LN_00015, partial [Propioniciclava sp.]
QRDTGLLEGKRPGEMIGRPSAVQAENARLRAQLLKAEKERDTAEAALGIMGKPARALGADLRERGHRQVSQDALMGASQDLAGARVSTRQAAELTGYRARRPFPESRAGAAH